MLSIKKFIKMETLNVIFIIKYIIKNLWNIRYNLLWIIQALTYFGIVVCLLNF